MGMEIAGKKLGIRISPALGFAAELRQQVDRAKLRWLQPAAAHRPEKTYAWIAKQVETIHAVMMSLPLVFCKCAS